MALPGMARRMMKAGMMRGGRKIARMAMRGLAVRKKHRRGRGLSSRDIRGFNKTISLLKRVGMVPRRLGGRARIHRRRCF